MMSKTVNSKFIIICLIGLLSFGLMGQYTFADDGDESITINREVNQYLFVEGPITDELVSMYEEGGWLFNPGENCFYRSVEYKNEPINIDGEDMKLDQDASVTIDKDELEDNDEIEIESITGNDTITVDIEDKNEIEIVENISINTTMQSMDIMTLSEEDEEDDNEIDGEVQLGQKNGEKPKKGDVVACNRFNGYLGNGRYYSNHASAKAIKNFYASDCDWALGRSTKCLKDYSGDASKRYCSLYSSSHYGKCSGLIKNGYSHSKKYHMHSSYKH